MPEQETPSSQEASETGAGKALLSFRDFLKTKAKESGIANRRHRRAEWLGALHRVLDQILDWLRQSDPDAIP
jgi:hypothetical protein